MRIWAVTLETWRYPYQKFDHFVFGEQLDDVRSKQETDLAFRGSSLLVN